MPYFAYYDPLYWGFFIVSLIIIVTAQVNVRSRFKKYSLVYNAKGITGRQAAEMVLRSAGIYNVTIEPTAGNLTDHYDPRSAVIRLSESVYDKATIAAVGIAAHEAGHAIQHAKGYAPLKVRNAIIPLTQVGPSIGVFLLVLGAAFNFPALITTGIALFSVALVFQLVTLPVEFNASRRAIEIIRNSGILTPDEQFGAASVLSAAAMTYLAAMLQTLLTLMYYILRFSNRRR
ncbi:MAG TPA: zinc metallopeptidase [Clostridiales bacterium]|nr:zinc metallopeptidase [Clostridiales bacterium]